ncbi:MAG: HAD family hydrolase, partial [Bifidobacteriaceae bacterium]|nr:HAD family hydrolase [Bifidobacteriaceae bacterium]
KPEILRLYLQAVEAGIRVAFISDMYLPSEFLRKILVTAGYKGLENSGFADAADSVSGSVAGSASASAKSGSASAEPGQPQFVIVSCEEGKEKTDGGLFKAAIEKHGWTKNSLHIGDSIRHDLIGARRAGIKSCLINRY